MQKCGTSNPVPETAESIDDEAATLYQSRARRPVAEMNQGEGTVVE